MGIVMIEECKMMIMTLMHLDQLHHAMTSHHLDFVFPSPLLHLVQLPALHLVTSTSLLIPMEEMHDHQPQEERRRHKLTLHRSRGRRKEMRAPPHFNQLRWVLVRPRRTATMTNKSTQSMG